MKPFGRVIILTAILFGWLFIAGLLLAQEQSEYKKVRLDKVNCDIGILYKLKPDGADIGVAAIATGYGAEFRKWVVSDIRLNIGGEKIRPNTEGRFFVNKESLFRLPGAVVFAVIGAQIPASGSALQKGITRTGAAIGLGILAYTAKGDIPGLRCIFNIDKDTVNKIVDGRDVVEITVEHPDLHVKHVIKVDLIRPEPAPKLIPDQSMMSTDDMQKTVDELSGQVER